MVTPLFVCHANCCRSVLACHLYRQLGDGDGAPAMSAGFEPGERINDRALAMLAGWGIDAGGHRPQRLRRVQCEEAGAIFVMAPSYLHRLLLEFGSDLADRAYLFADPFSRPQSFSQGEYRVSDPSFDQRPVQDVLREYSWMRERVIEIRRALRGTGRPMIPAAEYLGLVQSVDPRSH